MKYTNSEDGIPRTSIQVVIRLDAEDVAAIKAKLKRRGWPYSDQAVKEYVRSLTEFIPSEPVEGEE